MGLGGSYRGGVRWVMLDWGGSYRGGLGWGGSCSKTT